jgi:hypothetical protein
MRPVTLGSPSDPAHFDEWALSAFRQIEQASNDTLQNDTSSSGSALATVVGASANQIAYFTSETATAFTNLSPLAQTLLADTTAAAMLATIGAAGGGGLTVGSSTITSGTSPRILYDNSGILGELTDVQVTARIQAFTSSLSGAAPLSGGGTTNFLRADGTWAAPSGGGGGLTVGTTSISGGTNGRLLYDNSGVLGEETLASLLVSPPAIGGTTPNTAVFSTLGVTSTGATLATYAHAPSRQLIADGTTGSPVTAGDKPTIQISRIESIVDGTSSGDGSLGAALSVNLQTNNTQQANAFKATVITNPSGAGTTNDNVAVYGAAIMSGNAGQNHVAYGSFFVASSTTAGNFAVAVGTGVFNQTGSDESYSSGGFPVLTALDAVAMGPNLVTAGIILRGDGISTQFDVGIGIYPGAIKTNYIAAPNFSVSVAGVVTSAGSPGVACSGSPTASFASVGGIVTHC